MTDNEYKYVRVKDAAGNNFLCPLEALIDPNKASDEELENCLDDAVAGRYAANISIVDKVE